MVKTDDSDSDASGEHESESKASHFIRQAIEKDLAAGKNGGQLVTRFPPEPNGYLHVGHAKAICINFGLAEALGGRCHLRFDDTNPVKEAREFSAAMREDIHWLGFEWGEHEYFASSYFETLYEWAVLLIKAGKAYVDDLDVEAIREFRGTLTEPGRESPFRNRRVEENLDLFARMRRAEFANGEKVLRAKIDMGSPNLNLRDPVMYRVLHESHPHAGNKWCIYPMYDYAHGQSDWIEGITHSLCSLEFEDHRPLYDWFIDAIKEAGGGPAEIDYTPRQIEFARLNVSYTITSKRKLMALVEEGPVTGWDDPRMPTLRGMRRRGYSPKAIRNFIDRVGVAKRENLIQWELFEHVQREELNKTSERRMAVLNPLKVVITNYPDEGDDSEDVDELEAVNNPEDESAGKRKVRFSSVIYIERDDFMEDAPKKFFRLAPGQEVRLRYAYFITCDEVVRDDARNVVELRCTYDPATRGGDSPDGRKVKGTLHWVSAAHGVKAEVRLYGHLFAKENPNEVDDPETQDWRSNLNSDSRTVVKDCIVESSLRDAKAFERYQFERIGYFCVDPDTETEGRPVFNRTLTLKDSWGKIQKKMKK